MKRKTACVLVIIFSLSATFLLGGYLFTKNRENTVTRQPETIAQSNTPSPVPSSDNTSSEDTQPDVSEDEPTPFEAVPVIPDPACFTYEELADGTLRITGYDETKNTQNPYQVIIPSVIDGKPVSTLGTGVIASTKMLELVISEGITTLEDRVIASGWHLCLVALPDSVIHIDEQAFYQKNTDYAFSFAISCNSETSYAYEYAVENGFACRLVNPVTEENAFLQDYATGSHTSLPYHSHTRKEGSLHDYVAIEYRDIAYEVPEQMNSYYSGGAYNNEFAVLVLDRESGAVLQCIDSSSFHDQNKISLYDLPEVDCQYLLSIADYNFDGKPDLCLYQGVYGTGAFSLSAIFLFDKDSGLYTESSSLENTSLRPDKQCIDSYARGGAALHYVDRYQYIDGILTHVATLSTYDIWEDGSRGVGVRDERLIDGEWQVYREENILLEEDFSEETYQNARKQLTYLYIDDGYWDL